MNRFDYLSKKAIFGFALVFIAIQVQAQSGEPDGLARLAPDRMKVVNALWVENSLDLQFKSTNRVVIANIQGPAEITMIHFALPQTGPLNRNVLLRIYWDEETNPSVDCPLVDFFCDPNGVQDSVNSALVVVRRGFNCYFPMPFRRSARIELDYDGPVEPGQKLWKLMPCYSYVCYHGLTNVPPDTGYFCAGWKQETLKLGLKDYIALEAKGRGKFLGWNVTVRQPGRDHPPGDENEKFYIDGETNASIEFQGLEDSFGFSWGFPPTENLALWMGYFPFMRGDAGYRFFVPDSINFQKSLKVAIGFGNNEGRGFRQNYSKFGSSVEFSSTVYWYQIEPHMPLPPMPPAAERAPAPEKLFWPEEVKMPSAADYRARGVKLALFCGFPAGEIIYNEPGYSASWNSKNEPLPGWDGEVFYCRQNPKELELELNLPENAEGTLRLYIIDPDNFQGGRKETIIVGRETAGPFDHFQEGRWIEVPVGSEKTADGKVSVQVINARDGANAVLSKIEWMENK